MSSSPQESVPDALVITVSDRCSRGEQMDQSGPVVAKILRNAGFHVITIMVIPDDEPRIMHALRETAVPGRLVVTTGGTGIAPRDVTPEATRRVCGKIMDGLAEVMRTAGLRETPFAALSRGTAGIYNDALIVNLPGAPKGAATSLHAVLPILPHALRLLVDPLTTHPEPAVERPV